MRPDKEFLGKKVLWLSEADVKELLTMKEALGAVEEAFRLHGLGKTQMPSKIYLQFDPYDGDLRAMPSYIKEPLSAAGVKIVNSTPSNPSKGLPAVAGIMVYVDPETGLPLGLFAAGNLTAIRTGAAGGIAAKYMARKNSKTIGLIGCGRQAATQLEAMHEFFSIEKVWVWGKTLEEAKEFCRKIENGKLKIENGGLVPVATAQEAAGADILITTTPVHEPVLKKSWIKPGTHINAIGADAPGKQELETTLIKSARVVVDEWHQASHAGEINVPVEKGDFKEADLAAQLGDVVSGKKKVRQSDNDITVFDSTGLSIQDVAVSKIVFEKALKLNKGQVLKLNG